MYFDMPKMSSENFENRKFIHSLIWLSNCIILDIFHYFSFIGRWLKSVRAEHSATAKGENCAYGPTLLDIQQPILNLRIQFFFQTKSNQTRQKNSGNYLK